MSTIYPFSSKKHILCKKSIISYDCQQAMQCALQGTEEQDQEDEEDSTSLKQWNAEHKRM